MNTYNFIPEGDKYILLIMRNKIENINLELLEYANTHDKMSEGMKKALTLTESFILEFNKIAQEA